jgi:6-phosphogluconolactonase
MIETGMSFKRNIIIRDDPTLLAKQATEIFVAGAKRSIDEKRPFTVALSGGSTPRQMHKLLATEPFIQDIPWQNIHIFWVDERCVPPDSPESNFGTAKKDFIDAVPIPQTRIHWISGELSPRVSAKEYQKTLKHLFFFENASIPRFDLIFLGMGTDGHIASLFPGQKSLYEKENLIVAVKGGNPNVNRITMTLPLLNQARHIVFIVTGKKKSRMVHKVLEDGKIRLPAQKIRLRDGQVTWLMDRGAAALLTGNFHHDNVKE